MKTKALTEVEQLGEEELLRRETEFLERYYTSSGKGTVQALWGICRGQGRKLFLSVILCILQLSASLFLPIATANVIDAIVGQQPGFWGVIWWNLGIAAGLLAINYPLQRWYMKARDDAIRSIEAELRGAIVTKLQRLTIWFSKEMASGRILRKVMADVDAVRVLIGALTTQSVHVIVNFAMVAVLLLIKGCWQMILFFLLCGPLAVFIMRRFRKPLREKNRKYRLTVEETNAKVVDMVDMIPVTKAHGVEDEQRRLMTRQINDAAKEGYRLDRLSSKVQVVNWLLMKIFQLLCLALAAVLATQGEISVGDVTLYWSYFSTLVTYISVVVDMIVTITAGTESLRSIAEVLDSRDEEDDRDKKKVGDVRGEYVFSDVHFRYPGTDREVLQGLNLTVKAGETVALVGQSGAGKSTVVNLVTGFGFAEKGSVTLDGTDLRELDLNDYRQKIAVVLQNSVLFSGSIRDNITYGAPHFDEAFLQKVIDLACLREVIDELPQGLDTPVGEHGSNLSGGQRQRISIARAIIRDPQVIVLDEATSALDTVSEKRVQEAIENLSHGKTTFIVAHRLSTVKNADKIAVIEQGRCVEFGTYDELVAKKGAFYRFRELQV